MSMDEFRISLAAARKNAGYTQTDVAKLMNTSKQTVINWEKGRTDIGVQAFKTLCSLYEVPEDLISLPQ